MNKKAIREYLVQIVIGLLLLAALIYFLSQSTTSSTGILDWIKSVFP